MLNGPGGAQPSQNAQALAQRMTQMPQMAPSLPARPTQGLDIAGLLQQVQALVQPGPFGLQVNTTHGTPISGASQGQPTGAGVRGGLDTPTQWGDKKFVPLHMQLANMKPAQLLHTMGNAKAVAVAMQHLRQLRPLPNAPVHHAPAGNVFAHAGIAGNEY
jgi:hypothetical protein